MGCMKDYIRCIDALACIQKERCIDTGPHILFYLFILMAGRSLNEKTNKTQRYLKEGSGCEDSSLQINLVVSAKKGSRMTKDVSFS